MIPHFKEKLGHILFFKVWDHVHNKKRGLNPRSSDYRSAFHQKICKATCSEAKNYLGRSHNIKPVNIERIQQHSELLCLVIWVH